jgi:hypothetical protein
MGLTLRYTLYDSLELKQYFFSTSHIQRYRSGVKIHNSFVPISGYLPFEVVPRPCLPDGIVNTLEKMTMIFHDEETEIPNPDPLFQPEKEQLQ